jgi:hypothetical protein
MTTMTAMSGVDGELAELAGSFVTWLETGIRPADLFTEDIFADLSVPQWRLQTEGVDATFHLREDSHPFPGKVRIEALDRTSRGFLIQFEERWNTDGQQWYCREQIHCIVADGRISELVIYCTGDWDEKTQSAHAGQVRLLRS